MWPSHTCRIELQQNRQTLKKFNAENSGVFRTAYFFCFPFVTQMHLMKYSWVTSAPHILDANRPPEHCSATHNWTFADILSILYGNKDHPTSCVNTPKRDCQLSIVNRVHARNFVIAGVTCPQRGTHEVGWRLITTWNAVAMLVFADLSEFDDKQRFDNFTRKASCEENHTSAGLVLIFERTSNVRAPLHGTCCTVPPHGLQFRYKTFSFSAATMYGVEGLIAWTGLR